MRFLATSLILVVLALSFEICSSLESANSTRTGKIFSPFQIIRFQNTACEGASSRNGTCYTSEECASKGGTAGGSCAQGFGVCCIFIARCGDTVSQNCTYLVQTSTTSTVADPCIFTICKESSHICRLRLDFLTFSIAGPFLGTAVGDAGQDSGSLIGDCVQDTFIVTSPGKTASPEICGYNSGQHMIMDASNECNKAMFNFVGPATTRVFDIKVTQYACGDENAGPDGCLQYFTGNTGTFSSFNFPTNAATVGDTVTHLSKQCYTMCFRQELGKCAICYSVAILGGAATMDQASFGLSDSPDSAIAKSAQDGDCPADFLQIPGAERDAAPAGEMFEVGSLSTIIYQRICGRFFGFVTDAAIDMGVEDNGQSICTQRRPFRVLFKTDENELSAGNDATANEQNQFPAGIIGFHLNYALQDC